MHTTTATNPARYPKVRLSTFDLPACQLIAAAIAHYLHVHPRNHNGIGVDGAVLVPSQVGSRQPAAALSLPTAWSIRTIQALLDALADYGSDAAVIAQPVNGHTIQELRLIYLDLRTRDAQTVTFPLTRLLTQPATTVRLTDEDTLLDLGAAQTAATLRTMRADQPHGSTTTLISDITDLTDRHCPSAVFAPSPYIPVPALA